MKIVFLKSRLNFRGGLEKYTLRLARRFSEKNNDVTILTTGEVPSEENIDIISLGPTKKWNLYHHFHFNYLCTRWLKNHQFDVIFGLERNPFQTHYRAGSGVHAAYLKRRFKYASFFTKLKLLFNPFHWYILLLEKKAFENPSLEKLFTNSEMVKQEILSYFKINSQKIIVVFNGTAWKEKEQDSVQLTSDRPYVEFLFVGNGYKRKGLDILLPALSTLKEDFLLHVVGHDKNISSFEKKAQDMGLKDKIIFYGPQDNLTPFYQKSDVLLLPTLYDPCANVTLEALAMGLFVVTSQDNGASEVLREKSGIILKDLNDFHELKKALQMSLKKKKTKASVLEIRETIKHLEFSEQLDKIVAQTINYP